MDAIQLIKAYRPYIELCFLLLREGYIAYKEAKAKEAEHVEAALVAESR